jgi:predicted dienelactone hydrolase
MPAGERRPARGDRARGGAARATTLAAASFLLLLAACGDGASVSRDASTPDAEIPLASPADRAALLAAGPYVVGYRTQVVTYRPAGLETDRTLSVELWYPAEAGTGQDTVYRIGDALAVPRAGPRTGAELLAQGRFPTIIYSHGSSGLGLAAFSYGEYLASWGFVVAAPDHTGNTTLDSTNPLALDYLVRPQDLSATLDSVLSSSLLAGRTSGDVAAIGHSFGGYTVLSLLGARVDTALIPSWGVGNVTCDELPEPGSCELLADPAASAKLAAGFGDPRFEAVVAQTPVARVFAPGELAATERPVMLVTARQDATLLWAFHGAPIWDRLDGGDDVWVDLEKGGHYSVIAICELVAPGLLDASGLGVTTDGCGPGFTPIAEIVPVVMAYAHAYVRLHALGETRWRAVLAAEPFHADVTFTAKE